MIDREKVIKGLEHCAGDGCKGCQYYEDCEMEDGFTALARDALALLKAQSEELDRLKLCRHNCKIECLLDEYNKVVAERDALRKAQEPRVLTLEEMQEAAKNRDAVYVEESPEGSYARCFWGLVVGGIEPPKDGGYNYPGGVLFNVVDASDNMWDGDLYGLKTPLGWRCWDKRPTEEQREATPWN